MPFVAFAEPNGGSGGYEYVETGHPSDTLSRTYNAAVSLPYGEGEIFAWEDIEPSDEPSCGNAKSNERFFDSEIIKNAKFRAKRVAYDLSGRKVETPTSGNIYIRNGKKYIIR